VPWAHSVYFRFSSNGFREFHKSKKPNQNMKINKLQMPVLIVMTLVTTSIIPQVQARTTVSASDSIPHPSPMADKTEDPALMEPVKSVYANYLKIQAALAKDSLESVSEMAVAMAKAIKGDEMKMLPSDIARQAETLAKSSDLKTARKAFKPLSDSLIKYLADHKVQSGSYNEAYCPMAEASWLQAGKKINNPYMGKSMAGCGEIKRQF
jgi:hypothetical protein